MPARRPQTLIPTLCPLGFNSRKWRLFTASITTSSTPLLTRCPLSTDLAILIEGSRCFGQIPRMNASSLLHPSNTWRGEHRRKNTIWRSQRSCGSGESSEGLPERFMREDRQTFDNDNYFDGGRQWRFCAYSAGRQFASTRCSILRHETGHDEPVDLWGVPKLWNVLASISIGNVLEHEGGIAPWLRVLVSLRQRRCIVFHPDPIECYIAIVIPTEARVNLELQMYVDLLYELDITLLRRWLESALMEEDLCPSIWYAQYWKPSHMVAPLFRTTWAN